MSLRSLFLAGKDAYTAAGQLDDVTPGERAGIVAGVAATGVQDAYWKHRGQWVLDTGTQSMWTQDHFDDWPEALQAAMTLPQNQKTADVIIRCRGYEAGGVNPFDDTNPEPVTARLERLEQEWKQRLSENNRRHEIGAEGSPTGKTGWSYSKGRLTHVTALDEEVSRDVQAKMREVDKFKHPFRSTVRDAKAEGRAAKKAARKWNTLYTHKFK